jgi:hypothetical protein
MKHRTDAELAAELQRRGYIVRHQSEARHPLSWNRTVPFPQGVDFEAEALEKLRAQITPEMIRFIVEPAEAPAFEGDVGRPEIHRAILRVL